MQPEEQEMTVNLRPLIEVPVRWWRILFVSVILFLLIGLLQTTNVYKAPTYSASAGVAIIQSRTKVQFDTTAKTLSEEEIQETQGRDSTDGAAIRQVTLVNLVKSANIEEVVRTRLQDELTEEELAPGRLVAMVKGNVVETNNESGDLIQIVATHKDPMKATRIANVWAEEYEKLVNDLYARPPQITETMKGDLLETRKDYEQKQQQLTNFLSINRVEQMSNELSEKQRLLGLLRDARQQVISQVIQLDINANTQFYEAYLNAQTNNRILVFQEEQSKKRQLLSAYLNTQNNATLSLFNNEAKERQRKFDDAYAAKATNEQLLRQARALHKQAQEGGDPSSTALALTFLKMRVAGSYPPERFELTLTELGTVAPNDVVSDTRALVAALESQEQDIEATIAEQQELIVSGEGLFLNTPVTDTILVQKTMELYPQLFASGPLTLLEQSIGENTWLEQQMLATAEKMVNLSHEEDLVDYMTKDTPLNSLISSLEADIPLLQSQLVQEREKRSMLEQERDLAFNTYTTLARKVAEFELANQLPSTEVRFAAQASVPTSPSDSRTRTINFLGFFFAGAFLGLLGTVWMEFFGNGMQPKGPLLKWIATPQEIPEPYNARNQ
jgi:capsular polysaccharide biosynthesis protein